LASVCFCSAPCAVEIGLRYRALAHEALRALEVDLREIALGLGRRQLRFLLTRVEANEHVAFTNGRAGLEGNLLDDAGQVGAHRDALDGRNRSDRVQGGGPRLTNGDDGRDRRGRRLHRGELLGHRLELAELHEAERRDEHGDQREHRNHPFCHASLTQSLHDESSLHITERCAHRLLAVLTERREKAIRRGAERGGAGTSRKA
jgi:hypothetical protein